MSGRMILGQVLLCVGLFGFGCADSAHEPIQKDKTSNNNSTPKANNPTPKTNNPLPKNNTPSKCPESYVEVTRDGKASCELECLFGSACPDDFTCHSISGKNVCLPCDGDVLGTEIKQKKVCVPFCDPNGASCASSLSCQSLDSGQFICLEPLPSSSPIPSCPGAARCGETPQTASWQPMTALSMMAVPASQSPIQLMDQINLFSDGGADNAMGTMLETIKEVEAFNASLSSLEVGLVWEHLGIDTQQGGAYTLQFFRGVKKEETHQLDPQSIEAGAQAVESAQATLTGQTMVARANALTVNARLFGLAVKLVLHDVRMEGTIVPASGAQQGLGIKDGKISALIFKKDMISALNDAFDAQCSCVKDNGNAVASPVFKPSAKKPAEFVCPDTLDASGCGAQEQHCLDFPQKTCITTMVVSGLLFDTQVKDDGEMFNCITESTVECNAMSIALTFEGAPTSFGGVLSD